jgi:hypothetical protein
MGLKFACACVLTPLLIPAAFGQFMSMSATGDGDTMKVTLRNPMYRGGAIAGAPYSGEQVTENVQTLADGTHITQRHNSEKISRDSEGRTRSERSMVGGFQQETGSFVLVQITDPVAGYVYVLDDVEKVAHRTAIGKPPERKPVTAAAKPPTISTQVSKREELGEKTIEGVVVTGSHFTHTIPVGAQGNDRPLVSTTESWFSNELKVMVLSTHNDPRNGESTSKLINISRAEPEAALFLPPTGYQVVDEKDSFTVTLKRQ